MGGVGAYERRRGSVSWGVLGIALPLPAVLLVPGVVVGWAGCEEAGLESGLEVEGVALLRGSLDEGCWC